VVPHSLQEGPDGHYYTTDTVSGQIGEFDPVARTYVGHDIGGNALYPHTLRFDRQGRVWYTISFSNQVGMLDTRDDTTVSSTCRPTPIAHRCRRACRTASMSTRSTAASGTAR
jgi:streptogramin lyase